MEMKKRGRPKKEHAKTKGIRVRMTEDDFLAVTLFAEQRGVTKSELIMAGIHNLIQALDYDDFKKLYEKIIQAKNKITESRIESINQLNC